MARTDNIFSPAFGNRPSQIVGRTQILDALTEALDAPLGSRDRSTMVIGQRGSGKTVLLWELADIAKSKGYVVAEPTIVTEQMPERVLEKLQDASLEVIKARKLKVTGGSLGALGFSAGVQLETTDTEGHTFGYRLTKLVQELSSRGLGTLILIDEVQANSPELRQLISTYQEFVGQRLNVAICLAGLPSAVSATLNDHVLTFLNRANKIALEPLAFGDVDAYYRNAFQTLGLSISAELRRRASEEVQGSPYLLQLIGHNITRYAPSSGKVDANCLDEALAISLEEFERDVCETTLMALSSRDQDFLRAMSVDTAEATISQVAERMGVTVDYAQKYRMRLISAGVIEQAGRGKVRFAVPYLADYLRKNN